jgi:hypothetical protein
MANVKDMTLLRAVPAAALVVILAGTLVSGPLVPGVDFTRVRETEEGLDSIGSGDITITEATLPDRAVLQQGSYGAGSYRLLVPDATVVVANYTGRPIISYGIDIDEIGYSRNSIRILVNETDSRLTLPLEEDTLDKGQLDEQSYDAQLTLLTRASGNETVIATRNITVEVRS